MVSSDMDAKPKQEKSKLVQAHIAAIQRAHQHKQQMAQAMEAKGTTKAVQKRRAASAKDKASAIGNKVDTFA